MPDRPAVSVRNRHVDVVKLGLSFEILVGHHFDDHIVGHRQKSLRSGGDFLPRHLAAIAFALKAS